MLSIYDASGLKPEKQPNKVYDYIIVGAGTAGSVVANRLSEIEEVKVALLEAGKEPSLLTQIPGEVFSLVYTNEDWNRFSVPQKHACGGLRGHQARLASGRVLGGGSSVNFMLYARGNPLDYDRWSEMGATGWNYKQVLPYFIKAERSNLTDRTVESEYHGVSGPMFVTSPTVGDPLIEAYLASAQEYTGAPFGDYNGRHQTSIGFTQFNEMNGTRVSTANAYLKPVTKRKNLHIISEAFAEKVLFNSHKEAFGVIYKKKGKYYQIEAKREVILSCGSINTPKILMLSGIGPEDHLNTVGIPVISNLPVGHNLQDHTTVVAPTFASFAKFDFDERLMLLSYLINKTGPFASSRGAVVFANSKYSENSERPDLELHMITPWLSPRLRATLADFWSMDSYIYDLYLKEYDYSMLLYFFVTLLRPKSRGYVQLSSKNPEDKPIVDPCYLCHPHDARRLVEAVKIAMGIVDNEKLRTAGIDTTALPVPACQGFHDIPDLYLDCVVRTFSTTTFHQVGTCRMGQVNDRQSVVSPTLKVIGVKNLRVVDASIIPEITSGNPSAPIVMIAEKASDLIKEDYFKTI